MTHARNAIRSQSAVVSGTARPRGAPRAGRAARSFWPLLLSLIISLLIGTPASAQSDEAGTLEQAAIQAEAIASDSLRPIRTDSPRQTLATFLRLQDEIDLTTLDYRSSKSTAELERLRLLLRQAAALIDLSRVPAASRREVGNETALYLMDILGRIPPPNLDDFPDAATVADIDDRGRWRIPGTPIQIVHISDGPREGEFVFSSRTVQAARRFFEGIRTTPLRSRLDIDAWSDAYRQLTGPMIPAGIVDAMPAALTRIWLDTPVWKSIFIGILLVLAVVVLMVLFRLTERQMPENRFHAAVLRILKPALVVLAAHTLGWFMLAQIDPSGQFSNIVQITVTAVQAIGWASIFWLGAIAFFEALILSPRVPEGSIDANLLRLLARCIGVVGVVVILAIGGQEIGLPVLSLLAGLGVGGLAVALAIRPTLENLIGGIVLYVDKPVRVGDFCSFDSESGTVEKIGVRSTQLRSSSRTLISIPNAKFADMKLVNWARVDKMLIQEKIGVRYETDPDQLRYLLVEIRRMLHAHPGIDKNTIRVRFAGYGDSSLDIAIRIYALTCDWSEFHAIREDVLLRLYDLVIASGSDFAFPSQTVYMRRDSGIDEETAERAKANVNRWRDESHLPFPRLPQDEIERLEGTLDYPPKGSPEFHGAPNDGSAPPGADASGDTPRT